MCYLSHALYAVRYHIGEDPQCLLTVETPDKKEMLDMIAISPNMKTVAITTKSNALYFYSIDGKLIDTVKRIHEGNCDVGVKRVTKKDL